MFGDPVGGPHPPLLSPGTGIHPLFGPRPLAVAPPHEGYQRADHPLVSGITALQIQGDPQAGDADDCSRLPLQEWGGGGGLQAGGLPGLSRAVGVCGEGGVVQRSAAGERLRRRR